MKSCTAVNWYSPWTCVLMGPCFINKVISSTQYNLAYLTAYVIKLPVLISWLPESFSGAICEAANHCLSAWCLDLNTASQVLQCFYTARNLQNRIHKIIFCNSAFSAVLFTLYSALWWFCHNNSFTTPILFWMFPTVWGIFDIQDVTGIGSTVTFKWFIVIILTDTEYCFRLVATIGMESSECTGGLVVQNSTD
jgi:hypothetical protein